MLVGVEGKDLGPKFFLGIDLGVLEGQISGGSFSDSIFDPSVIGAKQYICSPVTSNCYMVVCHLNVFGQNCKNLPLLQWCIIAESERFKREDGLLDPSWGILHPSLRKFPPDWLLCRLL